MKLGMSGQPGQPAQYLQSIFIRQLVIGTSLSQHAFFTLCLNNRKYFLHLYFSSFFQLVEQVSID